MKLVLTTILLIASLILTACPSRTLEKAEQSSKKLASYANSGVNVTRDLYNERLLTFDQKNKIADAFIVLAKGGQAFDLAVANAKTQYGQDPPKAVINALFDTFNQDVVMKFLDVLTALKVITNSTAYLAVIEAVRGAVLLIAAAFGKRSTVEAQLSA